VCTCSTQQATLRTTLRTKAGEIEQKIVGLRSLYNELHTLLKRWEDCGGRKSDGQAQ
jgi:hypothetical protein